MSKNANHTFACQASSAWHEGVMSAITTSWLIYLVFGSMCLTASNAEPLTNAPASNNKYRNTEHHYQITFPSNWELTVPNMTFTQVKARAPEGYAAITVACRDSLWKGDTTSIRYQDAWKCLDGTAVSVFTNRFERNTPTVTNFIFSVEKAKLGKEKAIKLDYLLSDSVKKVSVRIRSFFVLHANHWYSVSCATLDSQPDLYLAAMLNAIETFEFYDAEGHG